MGGHLIPADCHHSKQTGMPAGSSLTLPATQGGACYLPETDDLGDQVMHLESGSCCKAELGLGLPSLGLVRVPATAQACLPVAIWSSVYFSCDSTTSVCFLAHKRDKAKSLCSLGHPPKGNPRTIVRLLLFPVLKEILPLCSHRPTAS